MNKTFFGYFLASVTVFFWGITFVSTKSLLQYFSSLEILFFRYCIAYIGLWIIHPKFMKIPTKENILFAIAGLTGVVLYQFSENIAIDFTSASNVSVIVSICPLFTAIIAQIFLKEKHVSPCFLVGFFISIIGIILINFNGQLNLQINPKGDFLALFASFSWGFYSLFLSILNSKKYNSICVTRRIFFFAILFMIPLVVFGSINKDFAFMSFHWDVFTNSLRFSKPLNWFNLLFLGLVASSFCFCAWNKACDLVGTVKITSWLYLIPVVTIVFASIFINEKITWMGAIGTIVTISGLFISEIKEHK